jgi:hypothetical protein
MLDRLGREIWCSIVRTLPKGTPKTGGRKKGSKNKRMAVPEAVKEAAAKAALASRPLFGGSLSLQRWATEAIMAAKEIS